MYVINRPGQMDKTDAMDVNVEGQKAKKAKTNLDNETENMASEEKKPPGAYGFEDPER